MKYQVYEIQPRLSCYHGLSLVAAESVEEANRFIADFDRNDPKNELDSGGYGKVSEYDIIEGVYSEKKGIVHMGIFYYG